MMRPPTFWDNPPGAPGWAARLLWPVSLVWRAGGALRNARATAYRAPVPVICVGNLTAGGAGKTPMVTALLTRLARRTPHVVSRGHGGTRRGPHRVSPGTDTAADVGDEPLLLARHAPVWVSRDRAAGVRAAVAAGAELILLDDGMQNPGIHKDAVVLMIDAGQGFGNQRVIPAGPLREPIGPGLARADIAVLVGTPQERARAMERWPVLTRLDPVGAMLLPDDSVAPGTRVFAFAGIGRPGKVFATLRDMGAEIAGTRAFPDHHPYRIEEVEHLLAEAARLGAVPVTTEKDAIRLPPRLAEQIRTLPVRLDVDDWPRLLEAIGQGGTHG